MSVYHNIYQEKVANKKAEVQNEILSTDFTVFLSYYTTVLNSFKYTILPENILPFMPEEQLIYWGLTCFFKDDDENYKIYPAYPCGDLLENGLYSAYNIISKNGKTWIRDVKDIELCFNNSSKIPSIWVINELTEKTVKSLNAIDVTLERVIMKPIISCKDEQQASMILDLYDKTKKYMPFATTFSDAFTDGDISITKFFDNKESDILALWDIYVRNRNRFYTTFGINNIEIQKKERLTEAEGAGNDEITRFTLLNDMYSCRKDWCERIKNHFGYEMNVELNRDITAVYELNTDNEEKKKIFEIESYKGTGFIDKPDEKNDEMEENKNAD